MTSFQMFAWAPDGIYDHQEFMVRYVISNGNPKVVISKMWVDQGGPDHLDAQLRTPWGTFPNMPPKPPKKG